METNKENKQNGLLGILAIVLTISLALNVILILKRTKVSVSKQDLITTNQQLSAEVSKYRGELNNYKGISAKIDQVIKEGDLKIEQKEREILSVKRENRLKGKENLLLAARIDSIKEQYLEMIDSLLVEREHSKIINNRIESLEDVIVELNTKLGLAGMLIGDNIIVSPIKKSGSGKKQATALAKKVNEIEICLDVLENRITKAGLKSIYFVITSPNAEVVVDGGGESPSFNHPEYKVESRYSKLEGLKYENKKVNICSNIIISKPLDNGLYVVEVFSEERKLGMTTFTLR
jgi:hypothetical protein